MKPKKTKISFLWLKLMGVKRRPKNDVWILKNGLMGIVSCEYDEMMMKYIINILRIYIMTETQPPLSLQHPEELFTDANFVQSPTSFSGIPDEKSPQTAKENNQNNNISSSGSFSGMPSESPGSPSLKKLSVSVKLPPKSPGKGGKRKSKKLRKSRKSKKSRKSR